MNNKVEQTDNVYRLCRIRGGYTSQEKAAHALSEAGYSISAASLKDYEREARIPGPVTAIALAEVYGTPELKWLHCSKNCEIGQDIIRTDPSIGTEDVYRTYFELAGAFNKINEVETQLHEIISDEVLSEEEIPILNSILEILDQVNDSTKELRIWAEKCKERLSS